MKILIGFNQASEFLNRQRAGVSYKISPALKARLIQMFGVETAEEAVAYIIDRVKNKGDEALVEFGSLIDKVEISSLEVSPTDIEQASDSVSGEVLKSLKIAASRIKAFHDAQRETIPQSIKVNDCYQISRPLDRVGVYAPGGTACYPSSVLMTAIPARCAGVGEVCLATPPGKDGKVPALTLAAACIAGVDRVFAMGGAQAIAALAFGTETVCNVDKICGPGNLFVMLAKKQVYGVVDIDGLQGPSEVVIVADELSNPAYIVNEILAQAEHDVMAQSVLITTSEKLAVQVEQMLDEQIDKLSRADITRQSLDATGIIAVCSCPKEAVKLVNMYAPEHLVLDVSLSGWDHSQFVNAGCVFTGSQPTVAMGDYVSGPSHALPTGGTARFSSPLNVNDFIRYYNIVNVTDKTLAEFGPVAVALANAEGLTAHARAVKDRLEGMQNG